MLQVDLSTLRGPELRQLLDATRRRGQAKLSYEILQEMEARREGGGQRVAAEPRVVGLNLGDPLEREPEDWEADAEEAEAEPAEPGDIDAGEPLRLEREPAWEPAPRAARVARAPPPPGASGVWGRRLRWAMGGIVAGAASGYALGFWVGTGGGAPAPAPPPKAAEATIAATASGLTVLTPPVAPAPPQTNAPPLTVEPTAPDPVSTSAAELATEPAPEAAPPEIAAVPVARAKGCAAPASPADGAICGDARLEALQRRLRAAYAQALVAHQDRALLRERQLAWRDARDDVTDPQRLARLYEARIRKLQAATAQARAGVTP